MVLPVKLQQQWRNYGAQVNFEVIVPGLSCGAYDAENLAIEVDHRHGDSNLHIAPTSVRNPTPEQTAGTSKFLPQFGYPTHQG